MATSFYCRQNDGRVTKTTMSANAKAASKEVSWKNFNKTNLNSNLSNISRITKIAIRRYHSATELPATWSFGARIILNDGTTFTSNIINVKLTNTSSNPSSADTDGAVTGPSALITNYIIMPSISKTQLSQINKIQIFTNGCSDKSTSDLYWKATDYPNEQTSHWWRVSFEYETSSELIPSGVTINNPTYNSGTYDPVKGIHSATFTWNASSYNSTVITPVPSISYNCELFNGTDWVSIYNGTDRSVTIESSNYSNLSSFKIRVKPYNNYANGSYSSEKTTSTFIPEKVDTSQSSFTIKDNNNTNLSFDSGLNGLLSTTTTCKITWTTSTKIVINGNYPITSFSINYKKNNLTQNPLAATYGNGTVSLFNNYNDTIVFTGYSVSVNYQNTTKTYTYTNFPTTNGNTTVIIGTNFTITPTFVKDWTIGTSMFRGHASFAISNKPSNLKTLKVIAYYSSNPTTETFDISSSSITSSVSVNIPKSKLSSDTTLTKIEISAINTSNGSIVFNCGSSKSVSKYTWDITDISLKSSLTSLPSIIISGFTNNLFWNSGTCKLDNLNFLGNISACSYRWYFTANDGSNFYEDTIQNSCSLEKVRTKFGNKTSFNIKVTVTEAKTGFSYSGTSAVTNNYTIVNYDSLNDLTSSATSYQQYKQSDFSSSGTLNKNSFSISGYYNKSDTATTSILTRRIRIESSNETTAATTTLNISNSGTQTVNFTCGNTGTTTVKFILEMLENTTVKFTQTKTININIINDLTPYVANSLIGAAGINVISNYLIQKWSDLKITNINSCKFSPSNGQKKLEILVKCGNFRYTFNYTNPGNEIILNKERLFNAGLYSKNYTNSNITFEITMYNTAGTKKETKIYNTTIKPAFFSYNYFSIDNAIKNSSNGYNITYRSNLNCPSALLTNTNLKLDITWTAQSILDSSKKFAGGYYSQTISNLNTNLSSRSYILNKPSNIEALTGNIKITMRSILYNPDKSTQIIEAETSFVIKIEVGELTIRKNRVGINTEPSSESAFTIMRQGGTNGKVISFFNTTSELGSFKASGSNLIIDCGNW